VVGTAESDRGCGLAKELHEKVVSNTSASQFDMRYGKKGGRKKKGSIAGHGIRTRHYGDSIDRPPGTVMNIPELHFPPTSTHSVYQVFARVRKCASRLLQKCNSMAKNKTA